MNANVLLVVQHLRRPLRDGISTYSRGLLQGLLAMGADDRPRLALHASRSSVQPDPLDAPAHPMTASRLPGPLLTRAWDHGLVRAPRTAAHLVHTTSLAFPATDRVPMTAMVHDLAWRDVPDAFPRRGRRWHEAAYLRALRRVDAIVVPAQQIAARIDHRHVVVIEEGCDHLPAPDRAAADALLTRAGLDPAAPFLLSVSTLEPRKNLRTLVAAYGKTRAEPTPLAPLLIVGADGWGDARPPATEGVVLAGPATGAELVSLYERATCFVYVPLVEGFGLPPVEAMRAGCPVVCSSAVPSVGDAALTVDAKDVDAIAAALLQAASDEPIRAELIAAGRKRAAQLTWENAARAHVDLWREVLDR